MKNTPNRCSLQCPLKITEIPGMVKIELFVISSLLKSSTPADSNMAKYGRKNLPKKTETKKSI